MKTILFIDSENFLKKIKMNINSSGVSFLKYNFRGLFDKVLKDLKIDEIELMNFFKNIDLCYNENKNQNE